MPIDTLPLSTIGDNGARSLPMATSGLAIGVGGKKGGSGGGG